MTNMRSPSQALMTSAAKELLEEARCVAPQPVSPLPRGLQFRKVSMWKPATAKAHLGRRISDLSGYTSGDVLLVVGRALDLSEVP